MCVLTGIKAFNHILLLFCYSQRDDGECVSVQGPGVLSSSQTPEHQESGQMVPHLEGQTQVVIYILTLAVEYLYMSHRSNIFDI